MIDGKTNKNDNENEYLNENSTDTIFIIPLAKAEISRKDHQWLGVATENVHRIIYIL